MLVELTVVEQRYRIVMEVVEQGLTVVEVAARHGVSRSTLHNWLRRYRLEGLAGLTDRSHRPSSCPHQMAAWLEGVVCELRRANPRWGPRRLEHELRREAVEPLPSRSSIYRALVRKGLVEPVPRRRREEYRRWQRDRPMELWQMDVVSFRLADGRMASILTAVDDHSRFCVSARVLARPDATSVCRAFREAVTTHGLPDQILTANGKVFTGRYGLHPGLVLFERICLQFGIKHLLTAPRSPTTTGKIERFHRTLRDELLRSSSFATVEKAQAAIDAYVVRYNTQRPHQSLDMATPAERFTSDEFKRVEPQLTDSEAAQLEAVRPEAITPDELVILRSPATTRSMRDDSVQVVRSQSGARALVLAVDRSSGRFGITSVWETAESREASLEAIGPMRERVFGAVGIDSPEFSSYEVVSVEFVGAGARRD